MKLSIANSAVYGIYKDGASHFLPRLGIAQCARAGFTRMEYNLSTGPQDAKLLAADNWRDTICQLKQTLDENGVAVPYTHGYWYLMAKAQNAEEIALKEKMIRRSVEASKMLGASLMVTHTQSVFDAEGYNPEKSHAYNKALLSELAELAAPYGLQIALENVFPIPGAIGHACYPEEMAELMRELNDPLFGICWDFGHANMAKLHHEKALETVAPWLRLLHAADNKGTADEHTVPGCGTVPWDKVMPKLKSLGYQGDLNMAVRTFAITTLPERRVDALKLLHTTGTDLIKLYQEA